MLAGQWLGYSRSNAGDVPNEFSNEENVRLRLLAVVLTVTGIRLLRGEKADVNGGRRLGPLVTQAV